MLGVWLRWMLMNTHRRRWQNWEQGLRLQARVYPAVAVLLVLAALCEAVLVIVVAQT